CRARCGRSTCPRPHRCSTWPSRGCARSPSGRGAPRSRAGRSSRSVCAPICRVWTPSASATARWTEMSSSHRDAHPYGRSADDVRRRDQRLRRTRRLRATQLAIFSILAVALVVIGVYAVGELREPVEDPGVIAEKSFGPEQIELTCPDPGAVPLEPGEVTVTVMYRTTRSGRGGEDTGERGGRCARVETPGTTGRADGRATIVHGPEGYLAARSVGAQRQEAQRELDEELEGTAVTMLIGDG